jgi:hypothetical protein
MCVNVLRGDRMLARMWVLLAASGLLWPAALAAQAPEPLEVGVSAPDFQLVGATRFGVLRDPVQLSDYRGKTVVVAFFYRVRTPG